MTQELDSGWNRFNDLPDGPTVSIYGEVRWPKNWERQDKEDWIRLERRLDTDPPDPNGKVSVLEHDLDPVGPKPNYLRFLRDLNPHVDWPDDPEETPIADTAGDRRDEPLPAINAQVKAKIELG